MWLCRARRRRCARRPPTTTTSPTPAQTAFRPTCRRSRRSSVTGAGLPSRAYATDDLRRLGLELGLARHHRPRAGCRRAGVRAGSRCRPATAPKPTRAPVICASIRTALLTRPPAIRCSATQGRSRCRRIPRSTSAPTARSRSCRAARRRMTISTVGRIKLVNPTAPVHGRQPTACSAAPAAASSIRTPACTWCRGTLESSNVNIAETMVNMIELARSYDMQVKAMKTAEDNAPTAPSCCRPADAPRGTRNHESSTMGRQNRSRRTADQDGGHLQQPRQRQHHRLQEGPRGVPGPAVPERARRSARPPRRTRRRRAGSNWAPACKLVATEKVYTQGNLNQTGNSLDLAINGRGFFQVLMPDGTLAYTRDGSFQINARARWSPRRATCCSRRSRFRKARRASPSAHDGTVRCCWRGRPRRRPWARCSSPISSIRPACSRWRQNLLVASASSGTARPASPASRAWARCSRAPPRARTSTCVEEMVNMIETQRAYEMNTKADRDHRPDAADTSTEPSL